MKNLVLFGPPGAGKGTQATFLKDTYNLIHISTGDVFRSNIKNETDLGILAKSFKFLLFFFIIYVGYFNNINI